MSDKPEKIFLSKLTHFDILCSVWGKKRVRDTDIEYIRADLAKPSEWISVDDRLPEDDRCVVAMGMGYCEIGFRSSVDINTEQWSDFHFDVSHWCELPASKPPEPTP